MNLHTQGLQTLDQLQAFIDGSQALDLEIQNRQQAYRFISETLRHFHYPRCTRAEKGLLRRYMIKVTGLSRAQVARLIQQQRRTGRLQDRRGPPAKPFRRRFTDADIRLLAELDTLHGTLSGNATRKLCERAWQLFGETRYERLATVSHGHLYNLRHSTTYQRRRRGFDKTRPRQVSIAERRRPRPDGRPGYLRVDSVHQGDQDGTKGLYHINLVDEEVQFQYIGSVAHLSERYLVPLLEDLIAAFPFVVRGVHADNGSEYINHKVAGLLQKLNVEEFTKSRARRTNDNALVESKNGSVIRKHLGYAHIPAHFAEEVNTFNRDVLSPYLNYHRPCFFPRIIEDDKGRRRKLYRYEDMMTPYEKLKTLPGAADSLRPGITFEGLDAIAMAISDNEAARQMNDARQALFQTINESQTTVA